MTRLLVNYLLADLDLVLVLRLVYLSDQYCQYVSRLLLFRRRHSQHKEWARQTIHSLRHHLQMRFPRLDNGRRVIAGFIDFSAYVL